MSKQSDLKKLQFILEKIEDAISYKNSYKSIPVKESYLTRNYIAHDYEGVNKYIIEIIIKEHFIQLKLDIENILKNKNTRNNR